ncbi:glycerophosphoryl diester phosphodiesterase [Formosimonas limnophila]|uniref:glycerophosphodiester phosphodiesterase n=1 Tax=Formosimonas limnophila TaxID=1384487 RepID=A0A8J3CGD7_9BURK|nr:glycerophosphodiester phosphodiesterase [Formosimonas limnophila]GHA69461.1 glycerophosphoryl diester phosphodiesterase [Formosimonas limnophila]
MLESLMNVQQCLLVGVMMGVSVAASAKEWNTLTGEPPLVIAHRGASGYMPDHTLAGYTKAVELGADFIEPDLVSTKDGVLIARHEPNLKDTTDIATRPEFAMYERVEKVDGRDEKGWFASDLTLAQIKTLRAKQPRADRNAAFDGQFEIPTFEEVLQLREKLSKQYKRAIGVYPETKHPAWHSEKGLEFEAGLVALLGKYNLNRADAPVFIQSFELTNLKALKAMTDVKKVYLIDGDDVAADGSVVTIRPYDFVKQGDVRTYADMLSDANLKEIAQVAQGIGPWKVYIASYKTEFGKTTRLPANNFIARAHAAGLAVHPFTFRNESKHLTSGDMGEPYNEYALYFQLGVDGVFSDYTDTAVAARARFAKDKK